MQLHNQKIYQDFVAKLKDGRILVVEYKGADRYSNDDSKEKRIVGEFWAKNSNGQCLFVMTNGKDFQCCRFYNPATVLVNIC
jgi:type III restriction enzyme